MRFGAEIAEKTSDAPDKTIRKAFFRKPALVFSDAKFGRNGGLQAEYFEIKTAAPPKRSSRTPFKQTSSKS
jgi:hypothetical protein